MASNAVSEDQARFIYLGMAILDSFTNISRDLISREISSTDIKKEISKCATFPKINNNQKMLVDNAATDGYKNFDISLLYVLLRNVCLKITPPTKGWGNVHKLPKPREITVGDDIERIRIIRNEVYGHVASASVPESDFNRYWPIISDVCHRMDRELGPGSKYEADVNSILIKNLDPDLLKKYREELNTNYQKESLAVQAIWDLRECLVQNKPTTEHHIEISGKSEVKHGGNAFLSAIIPSQWEETELTWQKVDDHGSHIINIQEQKYRGSSISSRNPYLVINNVDSNDSGSYQIEVSHQGGRQISPKINIHILGDPPKVHLSTPKQSGKTIIISCNISEVSMTVSLKWTKDDQDLDVSPSNGKFSGGTTKNPSLTIKDVDTDDVGDYQCAVTNAYGSTSSNRIRLEKPYIKLKEVKQLGNNVKISCSVTTHDSPTISKMEWKKDWLNLELSENEDKYQLISDDDVSLTIFDVDVSDQGQYQFSAMNLLGSNECKIFIDVSSFIYYRHNGESCFEHGGEDMYSLVELEVLPETENEFRCKPVVSKVIKEEISDKSDEEVQKILDGHQIIYFGLLLQEQFIISNGNWYQILERLSKHMGTTIETENRYREVMDRMECRYLLRNNGILKFASEQAERETLWAFLKNQRRFISNTEFVLKNATDYFHIARHFRTQGYSRKEGELYISLPEIFTDSFVKKLGIGVLDHPTIEDSSIYQIVSEELKIPTEVLQWGKEGQGRYINYLRSDRIEVYSARGMILGCAGSGKTTLLHRLRNDGMDKIRKITSTRGLEVHNDVFVVNNEATDLKANKENTRTHLKVPVEYITGQKCVKQETRFGYSPPLSDDYNITSSTLNMSASTSTTLTDDNNASSTLYMSASTSTTPKDESMGEKTLQTGEKKSFIRRLLNRLRQPKRKQFQQKQTIKNQYAQENVDDNIKEPKEEHVPDKVNKTEFDFKRVLNQCFQNICTQEEDIPKTVSFMDFAGQSGYYACHQTYLNSRAFFILVLNMKLGFDGMVEFDTEDSDPSLCDRDYTFFYKWKQRDFFIFWLKSIHIHCGQNARVLVVVTHAEERSEMEKDLFLKDLWRTAKTQEINISDHIVKIFFIGFPKREDEELEDIGYIRQYIAEMVKAQDSWGQLVPASWVLFEEILQNMKRDNKMLRFSQIQAMPKNMSEIVMDDEQVTDMLNFFNDIGVILFFQEESLKENIIIDIQWFIDAFKHVITDPKHAKEDLYSECINQWEEFNTTGILGEDLLEFIWKKSKHESQSFVKYKKELIDFMIRLSMMTDMETDEGKKCWYVPCVNRKPFRKDLFDKNKKSSSILCFLFDTLPDILFFKVVAKCSEFWKFSYENNEKCVFHTAVIFFDGDNDIVLSKTKRLITVQVIFVRENSTVGAEIRQKIENELCFLIKAFKYNLKYDVGYICDKKYSYSEDSCHHVIKESAIKDRKSLTCPLCPVTERHIIECREFTFWKEEGETTARTDEHKISPRRYEEPSLAPGLVGTSSSSRNTTPRTPSGHDTPPVRGTPSPRYTPSPNPTPQRRNQHQQQRVEDDGLSAQTRKAKDDSNRDVGNVASQGVRFILETSLRVPSVSRCRHISCVSSESAWVSDRDDGRLRQVDKHGSVIKTVSGRRTHWTGSHTVTRDGDLLFIHSNMRHVYRVAGEEQILTLQTDQCELSCIFSSPRNGDLLIGGYNRDDRGEYRGVVLRYNEAGDTCIQKIERHQAGRHLYTYIWYITENMNGDVLVSDWDNKLVVVDKSGRHRFTYTGHPSGSRFYPHGVCTDTSGRILLCDPYSSSVHILTRDGEFLSLLQTGDHGIEYPCSICMDNEQRVWVVDGYLFSNIVCIYRYPAPQ